MRFLLAAVLAGATALTLGVGAAGARPGQIVELPLGTSSHVYLFGVATGSDGAIWFADLGCSGLGKCGIGRLDPSGRLSLFTRGLRSGSVPFQIALGPDGDLWFTDEGDRPAIGRITPAGRITEYTRGLPRGATPFAIAPGPRDDMWFTAQGKRPGIGRITPGGRITVFTRGVRRTSAPFGIAGTPAGVWFTDHGCAGGGRCALGHVTPAGQITESHAGLRADTDPLGMAPGFGATVWFADGAGSIGEISATGRVTEHALAAGSAPVGIASGPDGSMWFTDEGSTPGIGRFSTTGAVRLFSRGLTAGSLPAAITAGPDGHLWFTDEGSTAAVGRVASGTHAAVRTAPALIGIPRAGQDLRCGPATFVPWAGLVAGAPVFGYDGVGWWRDGTQVARGPVYRVRARDAGHRLACTVTVSYPSPLQTTAVASSRAVRATRAGPGGAPS